MAQFRAWYLSVFGKSTIRKTICFWRNKIPKSYPTDHDDRHFCYSFPMYSSQVRSIISLGEELGSGAFSIVKKAIEKVPNIII